MKVDVLLGLQWGDEGKGKFVDALASGYDAVARFHGGSNAGHTLIFEGKKIVLNSIPSGILHADMINIIGSGVVLDVESFCNELRILTQVGYAVQRNGKLWISRKAHLLLPTHALLDKYAEEALGDTKIGSTQKGIAPAYADKILRKGLRVMDILAADFPARVVQLLSDHAKQLEQTFALRVDVNQLYADFMRNIEQLRQFSFVDAEWEINKLLLAGKRVLAEGAQATLLDIDHGSYPFVTSSNTIAGAACTGLGIAPKTIGLVYGVFKAYCTRVGNGPFASEINGGLADQLRMKGNEFGSVTKRPRRIGWLDLPALQYAIMINGVDRLIMTKADVLSGMDVVRVCTSYATESEFQGYSTNCETANGNVFFKDFAGWPEDIAALRERKDLPEALQQYLAFIEDALKIPITYISVGPDREQIIPS
ncbi:adenylosuccinate synthase [Sphingobacterium oryzagri]|uniref:Adenylosuccinate synthetase n=1 Tax=Sphingobacterium oryzagri TaxID=3025669 RepID=A0ABY7WDV4_9SPHI|nr:adenylosuccinate synthase [Sphingobacterium sp. KACC 22765]WDF67836.1 adenylosuccinate synthase [Sphingobacterium sp. KACC 22765]